MAKPKKQASIKKAREQRLPGTEDAALQEIEDAAASLLEARERYSATGKEVNEIEQTVVAVMEKHDRSFYKHGGLEVEIKQGKVKAKVKHSANENEDSEVRSEPAAA